MAPTIGVFYIVSLILCFTGPCFSYKPILFMHGVLSGPGEADHFVKWLAVKHPGTNLTAINAYSNAKSLKPMCNQVLDIGEQVKDILQNPEGVHLICFSQGGLICRALLCQFSHNVDTFISLSSPQSGQYGDTSYIQHMFPNFIKKNIYKLFYTVTGQKWSIGNYWNDPHHQDKYLQHSMFLAILNNQTFNPKSSEYRDNFLRLKNLVLIGGPDDGVITPWQSSQFGFYDDKENVVEMRDQQCYKSDWFGLKTLDKRGAIHTHSIPGVKHTQWHANHDVFDKYILPWLT